MTTIGSDGNVRLGLQMGEGASVTLIDLAGQPRRGFDIGTGWCGSLPYLSIVSKMVYTDGRNLFILVNDPGVDVLEADGVTYKRVSEVDG